MILTQYFLKSIIYIISFDPILFFNLILQQRNSCFHCVYASGYKKAVETSALNTIIVIFTRSTLDIELL